MKTNTRYLVITFMAFISMFWSCSLDETPTSFVDIDNYYKTEAQCISGLNSCYIPLKSIYTYTYLIATEGVTDLMHIKSGTLDAQLNISPAQPRFGQTMWTQGYKGVMYCNAAIYGIESAPINEDVKKKLLAEGVVLRAYYYWFLTSTFGDVPFYTEHVADDEVLDRISKLGRMPAKDTRDYLIKELQEYVPLMDQVRSDQIENNRVGAAMGWMILGKLAQWNKEWTIARDAMLKVEGIYGDLEQYSLEDIKLRNKNTSESIFEIQYTYSETGLKVTTNAACICTPTRSGGYTYDGIEIQELGNTATTWTAMRPNAYYFQSLITRRGTDRRKDLNLAWEYDGKQFNNAASVPWLGPKFWCPGMFNTADSNNQKVFRYADGLLMQAENYMELNDSDESIRYLNMVRTRAGITPYTFRNWDALREEIQKERGRELLGEYQRKYDLVRWDIWYQMTYDYTDYESVKNNMLPCHEYYPIPDVEVIYSGYNLDNKAYAAYGM